MLDWGLAETMVTLGVVPLGVPAPAWYDRYVFDPALPKQVVDVGLLFAPNFEVLQELAPGLIVLTPFLQMAAPMLARIAPLFSVTLFSPAADPLAIAEKATLTLADRMGVRARGDQLITSNRDLLATTRQRLATAKIGPVLVASPLDSRHVSIFGPHSLYGSVLSQVGLQNAAAGIVGEFAIAGIETLGSHGDATVVLVDSPVAPGMAARFANGRLWQTLPFVRQKRLHVVPPVLGSGGLPSAARFCSLLSNAFDENGVKLP